MSTDRERVEVLAKRIEAIPLRQLGWSANAQDIAEGVMASDWLRDLLAEAKADALREAQQVIAGEDTVEWARGADASYVSQSYAMRLLDDLIETTTEADDD